MKSRLAILFLSLLSGLRLFAHGDEVATRGPSAAQYFSVENISDKYELLLKYGPIHPGEPTELRLFVSDINTNRPVQGLDISVVSPTDTAQVFSLQAGEPGIYTLRTSFRQARPYALNVALRGGLGADLIQLGGIVPGQELPGHDVHDHAPAGNGAWVVLGMLLAFVAGVALTLLLGRRYPKGAAATLVLLLVSGLPLPEWNPVLAHGDEEHAEKSKGAGSDILVPKETQFLFDVTIARAGVERFAPTITLFGTVVPGALGKATVQSPLAGRLYAVRVRVGETVRAGQVLAVVEQSVDAGTQVNWQSEQNTVEAELMAAQQAVDRLNKVQDLIARRELDEANARLQRARENRELFQRLYGEARERNVRFFNLTAPISGRVEPFAQAPGATVNAGETLFVLLNPAKVIVEAQLYDKDAETLSAARDFQIECSNNEHRSRQIRLLAMPNSINPTNQSQIALFEVDNAAGDFKIGEFVNVRIYEQQTRDALLVPNSAITEISGMPAVFVKTKAEQYRLRYLKTGADNGTATVVANGLEEGERYVTTGTYQLKMVYFNQ